MQEFSSTEIHQSLLAFRVCFVGGESDEESVKDFQSGRGKVRWHVRKPYFYRRGRNLDGYRYRRRMRLTVETNKLIWSHEEDSDDDGFVHQETFILPANCATDEHGHPTELPIDGLQGYATEGATKLTQTFGGICKESQIVDATLDGQPAIRKEVVPPEPSLQGEIRSQWVTEAATLRPEDAIEDLWHCCKAGETKKNNVGVIRPLTCTSCGIDVKTMLSTVAVCTSCEKFV